MNKKDEQNIYHVNVYIFDEKNVIQTKSWLKINANVIAKIKKTFVSKRLYLESKYMHLWKW